MKRRREGNSNRKCNLLWQNKLKSKGPKRSNRNGWLPPPRRRPHIWSMAHLDKGKTPPPFSPCILKLKVKRCRTAVGGESIVDFFDGFCCGDVFFWGKSDLLPMFWGKCLIYTCDFDDIIFKWVDSQATTRWFNSWPDLIPKRWRSRLQSLKRSFLTTPQRILDDPHLPKSPFLGSTYEFSRVFCFCPPPKKKQPQQQDAERERKRLQQQELIGLPRYEGQTP